MKGLLRILGRYEKYLVAGLLILGFVLRTYRIDEPLADWHSWRQTDTASVSRNFVKDGFNLLYPQSDSLLALNEYGLPNPNRWFINEFPLYNAVVAALYKIFGVHESIGRYVSIIVSTLGALFLYLLAKDKLGLFVAVVTLLYYQLNPYNIYYSRVFMPDPTFVSLSIISLYLFSKWVASASGKIGACFVLVFSLAMLVKPYAIFLYIPLFYLLIEKKGYSSLKNKKNLFLLFFPLLPLVLWRFHAYLHPEGTFASKWLLNGDGIRFKGAFFRWIIYDRLNRLIFATGGFVLFVMGSVKSYSQKNSRLFTAWLLGILAYIVVFAKGNVNHDYYQLPIVPVGSVMFALGAKWIIDSSKSLSSKLANTALVSFLLLISIAFGWYEVRGYFNINNRAIVEAGRKIDALTPPDSLVIAPYQGDPAFLYQTNRHGWPIGGDIDNKIKSGADYYVTTSRDDEYQELKERYGLLHETDNYSIIKLGEPQ